MSNCFIYSHVSCNADWNSGRPTTFQAKTETGCLLRWCWLATPYCGEAEVEGTSAAPPGGGGGGSGEPAVAAAAAAMAALAAAMTGSGVCALAAAADGWGDPMPPVAGVARLGLCWWEWGRGPRGARGPDGLGMLAPGAHGVTLVASPRLHVRSTPWSMYFSLPWR